MNQKIKSDIIKIITSKQYQRYLIFAKGKDDRDNLKQWLENSRAPYEHASHIDRGLDEIVESCNKCGISAEKRKGFGNGDNRVMIILNSPVLISRIEKDLYKHDSITLLKNIVSALKLDFNECYITNLIKCEINESLVQPSEMVSNCSYIIKSEIDYYRPAIIIVMGDLIPLQKIIKESTNISWHNIEHPITLLKNPELKKKAWETLKVVIEKLREL